MASNDTTNQYFEEANDDDSDDDEAPDLIEIFAQDAATETPHAPSTTATKTSPNDAANETPKNANDNNNDAAAACPVTILSGFLGSGKTTLIQYILKSPDHGRRIAVIENEFGEGLAIESLIARDGIDPGSGSLQDLIELPNGCVCCTVKDSLVETLECLIDKRSDLDYILIEASGMADPGPIASVFWLDEALESRLRLDGIVTLVDGRHILGQLASTEEAARQIAYADRIVLNKVDLLEQKNRNHQRTNGPTHSVEEVEQALRSIHPTAPILKTSFSKIPDLDWILDADCFGGFDNLEAVQTGFDDHDRQHDHDHDHSHGHDHQHDEDCSECCDHGHEKHHNHHGRKQQHGHHNHDHKHTASITTVSLDYKGSVDVRKLHSWLADILWPNQDETDEVLTAMLTQQSLPPGGHSSPTNTKKEPQIFRVKGIVSIVQSEDYIEDDGDNGVESEVTDGGFALDRRRFVVQAVHDLWDVQPVVSRDLYWAPTDERTGKIVVIGKYLREASLRAGFRACFVPPKP